MLNFFNTIIEYLEIIWQFFLNLVNSLYTAILTLTTAVPFLYTFVRQMPFFISASCMIALAVVVCNYLIGRSNQ